MVFGMIGEKNPILKRACFRFQFSRPRLIWLSSENFPSAGMMARAVAGMGVAAELSTKAPFLATANLGLSSNSTARLMCLAPSALYSLNSSPYRPAGYLQLGLSVWKRSSTTRVATAATAPRAESGKDLESSIKETTSKEPVVVYSKSWCP